MVVDFCLFVTLIEEATFGLILISGVLIRSFLESIALCLISNLGISIALFLLRLILVFSGPLLSSSDVCKAEPGAGGGLVEAVLGISSVLSCSGVIGASI